MSTLKNETLTANLMKLPLLENYNQSQIATKVETFRKGEKNLFWFLKLGAMGAIGYAAWVYVLPPVFRAIGQAMAVAATGVLLVGLVVMAPVIFKGIRLLTRNIHKALIKYDPFAEIENQKQKFLQMVANFRMAQQKIVGLRQDMENEAARSEKEAEDGQATVLKLRAVATKIKAEMDNIEKTRGVAGRGDDDYVDLASKLQRKLAEAQLVESQLNQSKDFVQKYGSRANVMKKMSQKLKGVETALDIKVLTFDSTIAMLKKDYAFSQKSNEATTAAKSAMLFTNGWELEYAMEVVTNTISNDIAATTLNLKDLDRMTSQYTLDSDELYANLNLLADKIETGNDLVPSAKVYQHPDYVLSSTDRAKSGGFGDMGF